MTDCLSIAVVCTLDWLLNEYARNTLFVIYESDYSTKSRHFEFLLRGGDGTIGSQTVFHRRESAGDRAGLAGDRLFNGDAGERLGQSARATSLNQVLHAVVVNVEIFEHGLCAALVSTDRVVSHVNNNADKVVSLTGDFVGDVLHNGNGDDFLDAELGSKLLNGIIEVAAGSIGQKEHIGKDILSGIESRTTGAAIVLAGTDDGPDVSLGLRVGIGSGGNSQTLLDSEEVIILPNGTDAGLI